MPGDLFQEAVSLARMGKKGEARVLLELVLRDNPRNEAAWIWLADCAATEDERIETLERCLQAIPDARMARVGLEKLRHNTSVSKNGTAPRVTAPAESGLEGQKLEPEVQRPEPEVHKPELEVHQPEPEIHEPEPEVQEPEPQSRKPEAEGSPAAKSSLTPQEHRLPVDQFPVPGEPAVQDRTQPVRIARRTPPSVQNEANRPAGSGAVEQQAAPGGQQVAPDHQQAAPEQQQAAPVPPEPKPEPESASSKTRPINIFDPQVPRGPEPSPFTIAPSEFSQVTPHTPVIKPLKVQIERRLERDLGLDVPLPPDPTQRIPIRKKTARLSRGMIILYVAIALIALLGIAAFVAGLVFSGHLIQ